MAIAFGCPQCDKKYKVKDELAGKRAKCPCGNSIRVPVPAPVIEEDFGLSNSGLIGGASGLGSLLDEVEEEQRHSAPSGPSCPSCNAILADNAALCVKCGFDLQSGNRLSTSGNKTSGSKKKKKKRKQAVSSGVRFGATLLRGTIFSIIGAGLMAVVWVVVALVLQREIGWLAIGLGAAAGAGMALGHEDNDGTLAGIIASASAVMGLFAAKGFVYFCVFLPVLSLVNNPESMLGELSEDAIVQHVFELQLADKGLDEEELGEEEWKQEFESASQKVEGMSQEEYDVAESNVKAEFDQVMAELRETAEEEGLSKPTFMGTMFGPIDGLFVLLAVGAAYNLGSGQRTD